MRGRGSSRAGWPTPAQNLAVKGLALRGPSGPGNPAEVVAERGEPTAATAPTEGPITIDVSASRRSQDDDAGVAGRASADKEVPMAEPRTTACPELPGPDDFAPGMFLPNAHDPFKDPKRRLLRCQYLIEHGRSPSARHDD